MDCVGGFIPISEHDAVKYMAMIVIYSINVCHHLSLNIELHLSHL